MFDEVTPALTLPKRKMESGDSSPHSKWSLLAPAPESERRAAAAGERCVAARSKGHRCHADVRVFDTAKLAAVSDVPHADHLVRLAILTARREDRSLVRGESHRDHGVDKAFETADFLSCLRVP